jgi:hypothetical protein
METNLDPFDPSNLQISYYIKSTLDIQEFERYNQVIMGKIELFDEEDGNYKEIGFVQANKMLIELGCNNGWDALSIFDSESTTLEIGNTIMDFDENDWHPKLEKHYKNEIEGRNVLILTRIKIIPEYRGHRFSEYIIKDLYNNFIDGMALFVLKVFPLQYEGEIKDEMSKKMKQEKERDLKIGTRKLITLYKKIGFEIIPSLSKTIMFINPIFNNNKLNKINLD